MLKKTDIIFESGRILNSKMLDELKSFSLREIEIEYYEYCSGIIKGLNFKSDDSYLYLTPGILKYKGEYYFLTKEMIVMKFSEFGKQLYIYLAPVEIKEENNITVKELKVVISERKMYEDVIYLGEFQHYQNNSIKTEYEVLEDVGKAGEFLNIVNRKYAGKKGPTLSPEILYLYAKKILNEIFSNNLDNYIFTRGLNKEIVEIDILKSYLKASNDFEELYSLLLNKKFIKQNRVEESKVTTDEELGFGVEI